MGNYWIEDLNVIMQKIKGYAIEVHRNLGPGLLESIYEEQLKIPITIRIIDKF